MVFGSTCQSQVTSRTIRYCDHIELLDTKLSDETQLLIREAMNTGNKLDMLFWAPISIRGFSDLLENIRDVWTASNVGDLPMQGVQTRLPSDSSNEWPSHKAFLH